MDFVGDVGLRSNPEVIHCDVLEENLTTGGTHNVDGVVVARMGTCRIP